jgi:hypothetical protein
MATLVLLQLHHMGSCRVERTDYRGCE